MARGDKRKRSKSASSGGEHIPVRLAHQDPGPDLEVRENQEIREVVAIREDQGDQ